MKQLMRKALMMVGRARLLLGAGGPAPRVQLEILSGEVLDQVPHLQDYGFASRPLPGAEGVSLAIGGTRGQSVVIALADRRYRLELAQGEVALHDDQEQAVHLTRAGVRMVSPLKVEIEAPNIDLTAEEKITLTAPSIELSADDLVKLAAAVVKILADDVDLGAEGGLDAARKTDAVTGGVITGGSTRVKIA